MSFLSGVTDGIGDLVGGATDIISDNAGAIVGGIVGYYTFGMGAAWGAGLGSAAGSYVQHGDVKRAAGDGLLGATIGAAVGASAAAGPNVAGPNVAETTAARPPNNSFMTKAPVSSTSTTLPSTIQTSIVGPPLESPVYTGTPKPLTESFNTTRVPAKIPADQLSSVNTGGPFSQLSSVNTGSGISAQPSVGGRLPVNYRTAGVPVGNNPLVTSPSASYFDQAIDYAKNNKLKVAGGALMASSALSGSDQPERPDLKNEYDEYRACLASGRGDCVPPSSLQPSRRAPLSLGQSNQGRPVVNQRYASPYGSSAGIAALSDRSELLPSTTEQIQSGAAPLYSLMDELRTRRV